MFQVGQARRVDALIRTPSLISIRAPRNVWSLGLTSFLTDISSEMVASILPAYLVLQLGFTPLAFGAIDGLYQGATALTRLVGGFIADRTRRYKEVAAIGYAISTVSRLLLLFVSTASAIGAVIAIDRLGKGIRTAPRDAIIGLSVRRAELAGAFGVHRALDTAGAALGPLVAFGVLAIAHRAFDAVFLVSFALGVFGLAAVVLLVRNPADAAQSTTVERVTHSAILTLGHSREFRKLSIGAAALSLATVSDGFLYLVLQRDLGVDAAVLPLMFAGTAVCYFISAVPLGRAADRFGRRAVFLCGYIFLLLAYGVVLSRVTPMLQIVAVLALLGAYYGATDGVLAALASAVLPAPLRGTGLAVLTTGITLARLVGSVLFGYLWTVTAARSALQIFAGGLVTCLVLAAFTLSTGRQESRA